MNDDWWDRILYALRYIAWMFIAWIWYRTLLFRHFGTWTFLHSRSLLWGIVILFGCVGFFSKDERDQGGSAIALNQILGFGTYTALSYFPVRSKFILVCLATSALFSVGYAIYVLSAKVKIQHYKTMVIKKRLGQVRYVTKALFVLSMALIIGFVGYKPFLDLIIVNRNVSSIEEVEGQTISNNIEVLIQLDDDKWETLGKNERIDVLQTVANIEQRYLGLPDNLYVTSTYLDEGSAGYYSDDTKKIVVDEEHLMEDSSWSVLEIVCHEAYHSYQNRVVDVYTDLDKNEKRLLLFDGAAEYADEFNHYADGSNEENLDEYYGQRCESDADNYAEDAVFDYYFRIHEYLDGETDGSNPN